MQEIDRLLKNQDSFFKSKKTLSISYRKESLIRLRKAIQGHEDEIIEDMEYLLLIMKMKKRQNEPIFAVNYLLKKCVDGLDEKIKENE